MKSKSLRFGAFVALILFSFVRCGCEHSGQRQLVDYVDPNIGSISHLLVPTYPTVSLPNSMMRIFPMRDDFTTNYLRGLPLLTPGHRRGWSMSVIPQRGGDVKLPVELSYDNESTRPYKYSVYLDELMVEVDFALSHQSAIYDFVFEGDDVSRLVFPANKGAMSLEDGAVVGYSVLDGGDSRSYIYGEFSVEPSSSQPLGKGVIVDFEQKDVTLRYGVSFISVEQAKSNLRREISNFDVKELAMKGRQVWNEALGKIQVVGDSESDKEVFYTALYRCYERPVSISEDGHYYSAFDKKVHSDGGRPHYVDDWFWDTYRATHPLRILIDEQRECDIMHAIIEQTDCKAEGQQGLSRYPCILKGDAFRMNCNHGIISVWDAWVKGVRDFDLKKGFYAGKSSLENKTLIPWSAADAGELDTFYKEHGYFPALRKGQEEWVAEVDSFERRQSVAITLGTAYDSWALGKIAEELGLESEAELYLQRGLNYRNLFHPETKFFSPKDHDGNFIPDMDYRFDSGLGWRHYYDENNGFTYRWSVEHNVDDLFSLLGGKEAAREELDKLFNTPLGMGKYQYWANCGPDHTGNVGQFSMGNEPSFHIPYLYNYLGEPWKAQKMIRMLLDMWFRSDLMGIPGDEDGGGMSAFVVFSQFGLYPVTAGIPAYSIGTPTFERATMKLSRGGEFTIKANNLTPENKYIQSATLNGKPFNRSWISHEELTAGGVMEFEMGRKANKSWGLESNPESGYSSL